MPLTLAVPTSSAGPLALFFFAVLNHGLLYVENVDQILPSWHVKR